MDQGSSRHCTALAPLLLPQAVLTASYHSHRRESGPSSCCYCVLGCCWAEGGTERKWGCKHPGKVGS